MTDEDAAALLHGGLEARKQAWTNQGAGQPFGQVMEVLRELRGLSRRELEAASGRSYSQIRGLELGDRWPSDKSLASLAGPLGYAASQLLALRDQLLVRLARSGGAPHTVVEWLTLVPVRRDVPLRAVQEAGSRLDVVWTQDGHAVAAFEVTMDQGLPKLLATVIRDPLQSRVDSALQDRIGDSLVQALGAALAPVREAIGSLPPVDTTALAEALTPVASAAAAIRPLAEATRARRLAVAEQIAGLHLRELDLVEAYVKGLLDARQPVEIVEIID